MILTRVTRSPHAEENTWSFGQVLPLFLLALPLLGIGESYYSKFRPCNLHDHMLNNPGDL